MEEACYDVLNSYGLHPTPIRIKILKIILEAPDKEFTIPEIRDKTSRVMPPLTTSSIIATLLLFKMRGLVWEIKKGVNKNMNRKKGRPITKFIYVKKN